MSQKIGSVALLVYDYDEAIEFYTKRLGFVLLEDTLLSVDKRWVRVRPLGQTEQISCWLRQLPRNKRKK